MNGDLRITVIIRFPGPFVRLSEFLEYLCFFGRGSLGRQPRRDRFDRLAQQVQPFEVFLRQFADPRLFAACLTNKPSLSSRRIASTTGIGLHPNCRARRLCDSR